MVRLPLAAAALAVVASGSALVAQGTIVEVEVQPNPACRNDEVTAAVKGSGSCADLQVQFDFPGSPAVTVIDPQFPVQLGHTYTAAGTFTVRAGSSDPQCPDVVERTVEVDSCLLLEIWEDLPIFDLRPEIVGGFGLIQPGNPFPIVVFGKRFGTGGTILLEGDFGTVALQPLEWGSDGKFASGYVPGGICGVLDHTATIRIASNSGWTSDPWPVQFTAAREVQSLPREAASVVSCGHDSNKDCCNGECDGSDGGWFSACGSATSTICGSHYNVWAAIGNDKGTDHYRVDLSAGPWVVEGWDIDVNVDPGEGWAQLRHPNAYHEPVGDFVIDWEVTPNDDVFYDVFVTASGPCGTSLTSTYARSLMTTPWEWIRQRAPYDASAARDLERIRHAERRLSAESLRAAAAADRAVQRELERLRAAVTEKGTAAARELEALRADATSVRRMLADPDTDRERFAAEVERLRRRLQPEAGQE